jgi:DNA-binding response OmpR family regulator
MRRAIGALLRRIGYETSEAKTGPEALELATRLKPALVILEVNLEEVSGYEVCRELRDSFGSEISVIFVSAQRTTPSDRVAGLLVGADDYIVKPFDSDELLARVRAALRRRPVEPINSKDARRAADVSLTAREREVLRLLAQGSASPRSRLGSSSARRRSAATSNGSSPSSASTAAPRPWRSRTSKVS